MKIYAPNKQANGVWCSVRFVEGVGETDNPHLIKWFKEHGYKVPIEAAIEPKVEQKVEQKVEVDQPIKNDLEAMSFEELKEHAKSIGKGRGLAVMTTREQLIRHILK